MLRNSLIVFCLVSVAACFYYLFSARTKTAVIEGLSMSPTFLGPHEQYVCPKCGEQVRVTIDQSLDRRNKQTIRCTHCRGDLSHVVPSRLKGDVCAIVPKQPWRRWDVAAANDPRDKKRLLIKRVVGLPNETISIRDGDLFANGQRIQKSLEEFQRVAILVHDSIGDSRLGSSTAWTPHVDSAWRWEQQRWQTTPDSKSSTNRLQFIPPQHHPTVAKTPSAISDYNSFDPFSSRPLKNVCDIALSLQVRFLEPANFRIELHDGWHRWQIEFEGQTLRLYRDETQSAEVFRREFDWEKDTLIEFAAIDGRIIVAVDSEEVFCESEHASNERDAPAIPIVISSRSSILIERASVYRDIYYVPHPTKPESTRYQLNDEEYFLLGDNGYASIDSRYDPIGPFPRTHLLGKVELVTER